MIEEVSNDLNAKSIYLEAIHYDQPKSRTCNACKNALRYKYMIKLVADIMTEIIK